MLESTPLQQQPPIEIVDSNDEPDDPAEVMLRRGDFLRKLRELERQDEEERRLAYVEEVVLSDTYILESGHVVLDYELYLKHQRYHDDLKHIDCRYIDYGCIPSLGGGGSNNSRLMIEQDKKLGKGGFCWDAAFVLGEYLIAQNVVSESKQPLSVLELGCGTGLTGLMLAQAVPNLAIDLTDLPLLMPLLRRNICRNITAECIRQTENEQDNNNDNDGCNASENHDRFTPTCAPNTTVSSFVLDWFNVPKNCCDKYDLVIGADIVASIYDPVALADTIYKVASKHGAKVVLSTRQRLSTIHEEFHAVMSARNFRLTVIDSPKSRNRNTSINIILAELME